MASDGDGTFAPGRDLNGGNEPKNDSYCCKRWKWFFPVGIRLGRCGDRGNQSNQDGGESNVRKYSCAKCTDCGNDPDDSYACADRRYNNR